MTTKTTDAVLLDTGLSGPPEIVWSIRELQNQGFNGEYRLSTHDDQAVVHFCAGRIAWIRSHSCGEYLSGILLREARLPVVDLEAAMSDARTSARPLGEVLVERRLISRGLLRQCIRSHGTRHLERLLAMDGAIETALKPTAHAYRFELTFELDEVLPAATTEDPADEAVALVDRALEIAPKLVAVAAMCISRDLFVTGRASFELDEQGVDILTLAAAEVPRRLATSLPSTGGDTFVSMVSKDYLVSVAEVQWTREPWVLVAASHAASNLGRTVQALRSLCATPIPQ